MVTWSLVLLSFFMALIGTVVIAPLGWLLERMRMPERQKQGGLPRFVSQNVFIFLMLFCVGSFLAVDVPSEARSTWWYALLLLAVMAGIPAAGAWAVSRWLRRGRGRGQSSGQH